MIRGGLLVALQCIFYREEITILFLFVLFFDLDELSLKIRLLNVDPSVYGKHAGEI